jgi:zinc and cadmium transporter
MSAIEPILISTLIGSIGALLGGALLLLGKKISQNLIHVLVSFAAGALLGTAFFELLPEALEHAEEAHEAGAEINIFLFTLGGIIFFYLLERGIHWFQHSQKKYKNTHSSVNIPLVIIGDSVHNFIDGIAIAITFLVNPAAGLTTAFAVAAHELPQEIGDFAVLLHEGMNKKRVFFINLFSALIAILGALIALSFGERIEGILPYALSITAGFFIYIALSNLLPEIHGEEKKGFAFWESGFLILGVVTIYLAGLILPHSH